jgi:hypothetical protein
LENGVDHCSIHLKSVKDVDFGNFLRQLRDMFPDQRIAIFMDNMRVHHSRLSRQAYEELKLTPLFNIPYSP